LLRFAQFALKTFSQRLCAREFDVRVDDHTAEQDDDE
jgi:hypothetical protein